MLDLKPLSRCNSGAALIEYGMLVGLIAVIAVGAISVFGERVSQVFGDVSDKLSSSSISSEGGAVRTTPLVGEMSWSFEAGSFYSNYGFSSPSNYGEIDQGDFRIGRVVAIMSNSSGFLSISGDHSRLFPDLVLECNGDSWALADGAIEYWNANGWTTVTWGGSDRPAFVDGITYQCNLDRL